MAVKKKKPAESYKMRNDTATHYLDSLVRGRIRDILRIEIRKLVKELKQERNVKSKRSTKDSPPAVGSGES